MGHDKLSGHDGVFVPVTVPRVAGQTGLLQYVGARRDTVLLCSLSAPPEIMRSSVGVGNLTY